MSIFSRIAKTGGRGFRKFRKLQKQRSAEMKGVQQFSAPWALGGIAKGGLSAITKIAKIAKTVKATRFKTAIPRVAARVTRAVSGKIPITKTVTRALSGVVRAGRAARATRATGATRRATRTTKAIFQRKPTIPALRATSVPARVKVAAESYVKAMERKPVRTIAKTALAVGMGKAAMGLGERKEEAREDFGEGIGHFPEDVVSKVLPRGAGFTPGITPSFGSTPFVGGGRGSMFGGEVPMLAEPQVIRQWSTGTTEFVDVVDGTGKLQHYVMTKTGWKRYTRRKPIVLGTKHLTPRKFIMAAKKYYKVKKDLDKIFKVVKRK